MYFYSAVGNIQCIHPHVGVLNVRADPLYTDRWSKPVLLREIKHRNISTYSVNNAHLIRAHVGLVNYFVRTATQRRRLKMNETLLQCFK